MNLIHVSKFLFFLVVYTYALDEKKTSSRDVNNAESSADFALAKIPVYVIPNTPPGAEPKIPVTFIRNPYQSTYFNAAIKDGKQYKYGFYAPYKTPKITPIHEQQNEGYYALPSETPIAYGSPELYQKAEYEPAYKVPLVNPSYTKYEATPKTLLAKHQSISSSNAYASLAPVYAYPTNTDSGQAVTAATNAGGSYPQQSKKYTTYDPENNVQIQYVIKYVPVPYTLASADQYAFNAPQYAQASPQYAQSAPQYTYTASQYAHSSPETAYITPKPYQYKETAKKPTITIAQAVSQNVYASSTENYADYAKYAESAKYADSYTQTAADDYSQQYPQYKSYVSPSSYKFNDKNVYAKKYVPTSYVLASIGKSASTHYASSIRHDSASDQDSAYTTKLAPVPLTVDKYTAQDHYNKPAAAAPEDTKSYLENDYPSVLYSLPDNSIKYKSPLVAAPVSHFLNYEQESPFQFQSPSSSYHKKDVSKSVSSTRTADSSTEKLR